MNRLPPTLIRASIAVFPSRSRYVMPADALAAQPRTRPPPADSRRGAH